MEAHATAPDSYSLLEPELRKSYTSTAIALHWLIAALLFGQIAFGWFLTRIPRGIPQRGLYVNLHKSTGLIIAVLIIVRVLWRVTHPAPRLPSFMPVWQRAAARSSHVALYVAMIVMPASGYIASNFSKYGVELFNAITLPPWGIDNHRIYSVFNDTHEVTAYVFLALIVVHVLAAGRHAVRRDGVFWRMWHPGRGLSRIGLDL